MFGVAIDAGAILHLPHHAIDQVPFSQKMFAADDDAAVRRVMHFVLQDVQSGGNIRPHQRVA